MAKFPVPVRSSNPDPVTYDKNKQSPLSHLDRHSTASRPVDRHLLHHGGHGEAARPAGAFAPTAVAHLLGPVPPGRDPARRRRPRDAQDALPGGEPEPVHAHQAPNHRKVAQPQVLAQATGRARQAGPGTRRRGAAALHPQAQRGEATEESRARSPCQGYRCWREGQGSQARKDTGCQVRCR